MTQPGAPDPADKAPAEGEPDTQRPQDQGQGTGTDTADRQEPAEGGRDESPDGAQQGAAPALNPDGSAQADHPTGLTQADVGRHGERVQPQ